MRDCSLNGCSQTPRPASRDLKFLMQTQSLKNSNKKSYTSFSNGCISFLNVNVRSLKSTLLTWKRLCIYLESIQCMLALTETSPGDSDDCLPFFIMGYSRLISQIRKKSVEIERKGFRFLIELFVILPITKIWTLYRR